jgi:hypothetical protein
MITIANQFGMELGGINEEGTSTGLNHFQMERSWKVILL